MRALVLALSILLCGSPAFAQLILPPGPSGGGVPVGGSCATTNGMATFTSSTTLGCSGVVGTGGAMSSVTTISMSGQLTSTLATGTPPFVVASTTQVANLNAATLGGATFAAPGAIGGTTPSTATFTTITMSAGQILAQAGSVSVPGYSFNGATGIGFWDYNAGADIALVDNGTARMALGQHGIALQSSLVFGWSSGDPTGVAKDTTIARAAAGILIITTQTFANRGTPAVGSFFYCSDCDAPAAGIMATCTSAGAKTGAWAFRVNSTPAWGCIGI